MNIRYKNSELNKSTDKVIFEINDSGENFTFTSSIEEAINKANFEIELIEETINSINDLKPKCDKVDYMLSAGLGLICGIIDIFLVSKPGEAPFANITDKWFEERTKDFAKICGWSGGQSNSLSSAIRYLESKFKIPYDQTGIGEVFKENYITPKNHHFKSIGHNPSLLGLFFSILDQFSNTSHFVDETAFSDGIPSLITLSNSDGKFELRGKNVISKLFCAFTNWIGHLISDVSGSSGAKSRGMGIPSPLWTWTNDVIAIKSKINIPVGEFDKDVNELAVKIFNQGYDIRFQTAQTIPVFINEMLVRLVYSLRRLLKYYLKTEVESRSFKKLWAECEPFSNVTVKRMLAVAHGTFCLLDMSDATVRSFITGAGTFNPTEFFLRLNIIGVGRFTISLYGEMNRELKIIYGRREAEFIKRREIIIKDYICGLEVLSDVYDDKELLNFVDDLKESDMYKIAFDKTIKLAEKRKVPKDKIVRNKEDIDKYFRGDK